MTKEEADKIMRTPGETRGISISGDLKYVQLREGPERFKKLTDKMAELGYPVDPEMKSMDFCPLGLELLSLLLIKEIFDYKEEDFYEMGAFSSRMSLILRLFMKYFVSVTSIAGQASKIWKRYYSLGKFEIINVDEKNRVAVARLEGFKLHPLHCHNIRGYIANIIKMITDKPVYSRETKCPFRGDEYHEFEVKW